MQYNLDKYSRLDQIPKDTERIESAGKCELCSYMVGLSKFLLMLTRHEYNLKIYSSVFKDIYHYRLKYYAIDSTGLVYGFIYGPLTFEEKYSPQTFEPDRFFGTKKINGYNILNYDCVVKMGADNTYDELPVGLNTLRNKYLPLITHSNNYFESKNENDIRAFGPTIYRNNSRSFYLPFVELISENLKLDYPPDYILPKYEKEHISFETRYSWRTRKHDHWKIWKGLISYETFEITDIVLIDEQSEYNW
jgi:hypothetical protein